MLFALTQNDRLVEWQIPVRTAQYCGVKEANFTWFDSNEKIIRGPPVGLFPYLTVVMLIRCG
jgi:hypothetical protein